MLLISKIKRISKTYEQIGMERMQYFSSFINCVIMNKFLFQIPKFFASMYTHPTTAEQCLHNALKVVEAIRYLGMDYDVVVSLSC